MFRFPAILSNAGSTRGHTQRTVYRPARTLPAHLWSSISYGRIGTSFSLREARSLSAAARERHSEGGRPSAGAAGVIDAATVQVAGPKKILRNANSPALLCAIDRRDTGLVYLLRRDAPKEPAIPGEDLEGSVEKESPSRGRTESRRER